MDPKTLTKEQRTKAISSILFLKDKHDGSMKRRACALGTPWWSYTNKKDSAFPTCVTKLVSTKLVFITLVIDAHERRHVATFDIPCTFLHVLTNKDMAMMLEYRLAELMVKVDRNCTGSTLPQTARVVQYCTWTCIKPCMVCSTWRYYSNINWSEIWSRTILRLILMIHVWLIRWLEGPNWQ